MKDFISKKIDVLMEKLRLIHNLMVALLSGMAGIVFGILSKKLILDLGIIISIAIGILILVALFNKEQKILDEQKMFLDKLKDLE